MIQSTLADHQSTAPTNEPPADPDPLDDLTGFQRDLLYVAAEMPDSWGVEIWEVLQEGYADRIGEARFYKNLRTLVGEGWMDAERADSEDRAKIYRVTDAGREALRDDLAWRRERLG